MNERLLQWGSPRLVFRNPIVIISKQMHNDPQGFNVLRCSREFEFLLCERFVYVFHYGCEASNFGGKLDVRTITRRL